MLQQLQDAAEQALALMRRQGFEHAQVDARPRRCTSSTSPTTSPACIASTLLTLKSRFDAPGVAALTRLTPGLYASRKTGIAHVPLAASGWEVEAGDTPREQMIAAVQRGALVDRLSMGNPAPNGNFSGVIKNSFAIDGGRVTGAPSETMIGGNIAQTLRDAAAMSAERIDRGDRLLPWLRIRGLHFS